MWKDRNPNISYFHIFGYRFFIHNNVKDNLENFDVKLDEGVFLGYSTTSKAYRIFNKRTLVVEESIHVTSDESNNTHLEKRTKDDENILESEVIKINN